MNAPLPGFLLVVEDSDEDFDTVIDAARDAGLTQEIRRAASGDECLRLLAAWERDGHAMPALVILDLNTPEGNGREALCSIRKQERLHALPLVILSTSTDPRDLEFCSTMGANAYHTKPVDYPAHMQILRHIFAGWLGANVPPPR